MVDRETLRRMLLDERSQHLSLLTEHGADPYGDAVLDLGVEDVGFADAAHATEARAEVLGQIETARTRVHQIDAALTRMDEGTYGTCASCGTSIAPARLEARPLAAHCVGCAEREAS
jgi:DnaK suppressor protein